MTKWEGLGPACSDTVAKLIEIGLPEDARSKAYDLCWALAVWQGDRELEEGKRAILDAAYRLINERPGGGVAF